MIDLTYTNIVLKIGGQLLLVFIGILAVTFGIDTPWPKSNINRMINQMKPAPEAPEALKAPEGVSKGRRRYPIVPEQ